MRETADTVRHGIMNRQDDGLTLYRVVVPNAHETHFTFLRKTTRI